MPSTSRIKGLLDVESVLRDIDQGALRRAAVRCLVIVTLFGAIYGAAMGTFGGLAGDRPWQVVYSATKVPMLLAVTFLLALPTFFVLNTLMGLQRDFPSVLRALFQTQAGLTLLLASLAPFTLLWYASFEDYPTAVLFNGVLFGAASFSSQVILRRCYRRLIGGNPRHGPMIVAWLILYVFIAVQMAWVLRPFVGDSHLPVRFFREDAWNENAYVVVIRSILRMIR